MKAHTLLVLALALTAPVAFAQRNFDNVEIKVIPGNIPGHGKLATVGDLRSFHTMLVETIGLVREGIAGGKSLADLKAAGLPEKYKDFGTGFIKTDRWIETIYNSTKR